MPITLGAAALAAVFAAPAWAMTITGEELLDSPEVSLPNPLLTRNVDVAGAVEWPATGVDGPVLIRWDAFDAGEFDASDGASFGLTFEVTRNTLDFDFYVSLWDGSRYEGMASLFDGDGFAVVSGVSDGVTILSQDISNLQDYADAQSIGETVQISVEWLFAGGDVTVTATPPASYGARMATFASTLDRTGPLSVLFSAQSSTEGFVLNSITSDLFSSPGGADVPLPGAAGLLAAGLGALALLRRRRAAG